MKQVVIKQGQAVVEDVPEPCVSANTVLVAVTHSAISTGTEMSGVTMSGAPLWKRALKQPQNVKKVLQMVASNGLAKTKSFVSGQLSAGNATGYSAAGMVIAVGENITDIAIGDRVACAGAQCAHHAEVICVPRNLVVPIPEKISFAAAATVTLGAIALQGVRRATPTLGETFVVIGLGLLGQLSVQMLKANGCRVIGVDLDKERLALALQLGMDLAITPEIDSIEEAKRLTAGIGVDGVIITAATPSNAVISTAFNMCRKKGRVVLVGDVGLHLQREDFYKKELDFFISSSYGPGRYDERYEEEGLDYPVAYVRWTENRNMQAYLNLIADNKINLEALISANFKIDDASKAYEFIKTQQPKPLIVILEYPQKTTDYKLNHVIKVNKVLPSHAPIRLAIVGAGGFAKGMHLPNIQHLSKTIHLQAVVSRSGHNAKATAKQFAANYATTNYEEVLKDQDVNAVLITTRHDTHAEFTLKALQAGKHVLVEKPLVLTEDELQRIKNFYQTHSDPIHAPMLMVGFNRRFSKIMQTIKANTVKRNHPMIMNYRMNAGFIALDHWVHGREGGGRNIGEACHIYDLFTFLTNSEVTSIHAAAIEPQSQYYASNDNFVVTLQFADGSVGNLIYTAMGSKDYAKEHLEVFVEGKVFVMTDYKTLNVSGANIKPIKNNIADKGQLDELKAFAAAISQNGEWPIPLWQLVQATEIAFAVEKQVLNRHDAMTP